MFPETCFRDCFLVLPCFHTARKHEMFLPCSRSKFCFLETKLTLETMFLVWQNWETFGKHARATGVSGNMLPRFARPLARAFLQNIFQMLHKISPINASDFFNPPLTKRLKMSSLISRRFVKHISASLSSSSNYNMRQNMSSIVSTSKAGVVCLHVSKHALFRRLVSV